MRGVQFGSYHTADDWELILNAKSLTPPEPKTQYIEIPGRDGDLDFSEALSGEVKYNNRIASFTFLVTEGSHSEREETISDIIAYLHGQRRSIIDEDKPGYYLLGRCTVTERTNNKAYGVIGVECNCEPWFYAENETTRSFTVSASQNIVLVNNGQKTLVPEITVTGTITLAYGSNNVSLTAGTYKLTNLQLKSGNTPITLGGSGTVSFTYREGVL